VRFRVTALASLAVAGLLAVAGAGLVAAQERSLTRSLDGALDGWADELAALVADDQLPPRLSDRGNDDFVGQVVTERGRVLSASPNLSGRLPVGPAPPAGETGTLRTDTDLPIDDDPFRLLSRRVDGPDGPVVVHVAGTLDDIGESTAALGRSLTVAVPAVTLVLGLLVWWLVGRTLRPVEAIRAEVADIGGSGLDRRVPAPAGDDEIARLARTMNAMLDRVEAAARQQQRFVADASHELRSPLARMRSELEVDLAHPGRSDPVATHRSVLDETVGLQQLVTDLLHLARSDAGAARPPGDAPVDLDDIVLRHGRRLRTEGGVAVDMSGVSAAQVGGDAVQLDRVVANLADNAARHAAGTVTLTLGEHGDLAVLTVTDDGPGIPPEARELVFERFARLDDARHHRTGGAGLGLAIARDVVERHGGTIRVEPGAGPGARFVVTLPRAQARGREPARV
jgi:signal transduction histidine kinase